MTTGNSQWINFLDKKKKTNSRNFKLTLSQATWIRNRNHGETCWNHQQRRRKQAMGQGSDGCKLSQLTAYCSVLWQWWRGTLELEAFTTWVMLKSRPLHIYWNCSNIFTMWALWPVWRKKWFGGAIFQGKWSARTIFPCKIWSGLGIMIQVRVRHLITIAVYERIWFCAEGSQ